MELLPILDRLAQAALAALVSGFSRTSERRELEVPVLESLRKLALQRQRAAERA